MSKKAQCIVLTGPTAVGKTALSIKLAKALNGSIISADSMQVYKMMDIGSAKITKEEMEGIPHYLVDELDPRDEFGVAVFCRMAKAAMEDIYAKGRLPIITGGTGFYIQALLKDLPFDDEAGQSAIRDQYQEYARQNGAEELHTLLKEKDPASAEAIHPNNVKRVIRALEFFEETGKPISANNEMQKQIDSPYLYAYFVLDDERENLYRRIDQRVDLMIEQGLVEEVRKLKDMGLTEDHISMKGLGYKELFPYLDGQISLSEAIAVIKRDTRHFAKRQLTWFRREKDVIWVNKKEYDYDEDRILASMIETFKSKVREEEGHEL